MKFHKLQFTNDRGQNLSANLEMPITERPIAYALFAHCFTCSKNLSAVVNISRSLTQKGIAVLRFDFTGLGNSEGTFSETNFSTNVSDLKVAYEFLRKEYAAPNIIIGHSLGGAAVLAASFDMPEVKAVVTVGAPAHPDHVLHMFDKKLQEIEKEGIAQVNIGGRPFNISSQLVTDLKKSDVNTELKQLKKALLVMHSPQDSIVSIDNAKIIYDAAMHPKSFVTLDRADHLLTNKSDSEYTGQLIATWASRYVTPIRYEELITNKEAVTRTGDGSYLTEIVAGNHQLLADEPKSVGGDDHGPTPYDLLISSLGACTGMTLRMYADRKGWDLREARVHLEHYKDHADDGQHTDSNKAKLDHIDREIELFGNLDDAQRERLLEIADRCPVHKTLHSEIVIKTTLAS